MKKQWTDGAGVQVVTSIPDTLHLCPNCQKQVVSGMDCNGAPRICGTCALDIVVARSMTITSPEEKQDLYYRGAADRSEKQRGVLIKAFLMGVVAGILMVAGTIVTGALR